MKITFAPQRRDDPLTVAKSGDSLTINGEMFDFGVIPDGADLPAEAVACDLIVGTVRRVSGDLQLTLILPHGPYPSPAVAFPADLIDPPNGPLAIPFDPPVVEPADE